MDLKMKGQRFLVTGASSGMGRAVAEALLNEGAFVIVNARREELFNDLILAHPGSVEVVAGDIREEAVRQAVVNTIGSGSLHGVLVNAGGPPAKGFLETAMDDWDKAYLDLLRWKVSLVKDLLPVFEGAGYGRILFLESISVKQPVPSLVLSNSLRMAVVGMAKTLSDEVAPQGITVNVLAPGYHATPAIDRVLKKASEVRGLTVDEVTRTLVGDIPLKRMGEAHEIASLALWLLSPASAYITGQTFSVDGGRVRGSYG
jgi:3-oxoacyl-[acyl-carrier protein] reductase